MTRIAVIADTHDRVPPGLLERLAAADEIWHLGDVCAPETLAEFETLGKPLHVVIGNNEWHNLWPVELRLERHGQRFHLVHIPPRHAPAGIRFLLLDLHVGIEKEAARKSAGVVSAVSIPLTLVLWGVLL